MGFQDVLIGRAAAAVDRALVLGMERRNRHVRARAEVMSHAERMDRLALIRSAYSGTHLIESPETFFPAPAPIEPSLRRVRKIEGGEVLDASWSSEVDPYLPEMREPFESHLPNRTAHARLYASKVVRPTVVLLHGYMAGQWAVEERAWPIEWLRGLGLDVAIAVLPFHALRGQDGAPPWPGANPRMTNEGFRQAVSDVRALMGYLQARGAPAVGVMGMSLGGYTASLLATVVKDLSFSIPLIPLASLADFARDHGRLGEGPTAFEQHRALEHANWVVSPLARPCRLPPERVLIVGAEADRITPIAHAERIATHFGAPLHRLRGGHLLQLWRTEAFREVRRMWKRIGLI